MAVPATRASALTYGAVVVAVVVLVQVFAGPALIDEGATGVLFLATWSLAGLLLAAVPLVPPSVAQLVSASASVGAAVSLLLGVAATVSHPSTGDTPAVLGAALLLVTVAVRPRRPESAATAAPLPKEPAPHLWS